MKGSELSAEIVNLNKFRKARRKSAKEADAVENRRKHGRTKTERIADKKSRIDAERALDGRKLSVRPNPDDQDAPR